MTTTALRITFPGYEEECLLSVVVFLTGRMHHMFIKAYFNFF